MHACVRTHINTHIHTYMHICTQAAKSQLTPRISNLKQESQLKPTGAFDITDKHNLMRGTPVRRIYIYIYVCMSCLIEIDNICFVHENVLLVTICEHPGESSHVWCDLHVSIQEHTHTHTHTH